MRGEHLLMCGHGHSPPELLATNLLDVVGTGDIDALRYEGLGTTLSQIVIGAEAMAEVKVSEETMRDITH